MMQFHHYNSYFDIVNPVVLQGVNPGMIICPREKPHQGAIGLGSRR